MKREFVMELTRIAKKAGGDRYECSVEGQDKPMVIYWPQSVSRMATDDGGAMHQKLRVTVEPI